MAFDGGLFTAKPMTIVICQKFMWKLLNHSVPFLTPNEGILISLCRRFDVDNQLSDTTTALSNQLGPQLTTVSEREKLVFDIWYVQRLPK